MLFLVLSLFYLALDPEQHQFLAQLFVLGFIPCDLIIYAAVSCYCYVHALLPGSISSHFAI